MTITAGLDPVNTRLDAANTSLDVIETFITVKTPVMKTGQLTTVLVTPDQVVLAYTVTLLKTFYLSYLRMKGRFTAPDGNPNPQLLGSISLETSLATKVITEDASGLGSFWDVVFSFPEPIPIPSASLVRVVATPSSTRSRLWTASLGGVEK